MFQKATINYFQFYYFLIAHNFKIATIIYIYDKMHINTQSISGSNLMSKSSSCQDLLKDDENDENNLPQYVPSLEAGVGR